MNRAPKNDVCRVRKLLTQAKGGAWFEEVRLPARARITRIHVHCADHVDGIQFEYATPDGGAGLGPFIGGVGGDRCTFDLGAEDELTGLTGSFGQYVNSLQFQGTNQESLVFGRREGESFEINFGGRYRFCGVYGREGRYLDSLGVVLEERSMERQQNSVAERSRANAASLLSALDSGCRAA